MNIDGRRYLVPDWPAPPGVRAVSTTRVGGHSAAPFDSFNLGLRSGDVPEVVGRNLGLLAGDLRLPREPRWLRQVHGTCVVGDGDGDGDGAPEADASVTSRANVVCAVLTADCLPVLLSTLDGGSVAAAHAGWRGLAAGVLENVVEDLARPGGAIMAWLGPGIGPRAFEVGDEVREAFLERDAGCGACFQPSPSGRWLADLPGLATRRLHGIGITRIYGGETCTYSEPERFFSYRRDQRTGRMASLIWIEPES